MSLTTFEASRKAICNVRFDGSEDECKKKLIKVSLAHTTCLPHNTP